MSHRASIAVVATVVTVALLATTALARAESAGQGHVATSHHARRAPEVLVSFHFGTNPALALGGFNAAHDLRVGQLRVGFARGERLERRLLRSVVSEASDAPELGLVEAISAGASVAAALSERTYIAADVKVEAIDVYAASEISHARSMTAGVEIGWRVHVWRGAYLTPSLRLWPEVWDDVPDAGVAVENGAGRLIGYTPAREIDGGVFANVMLGWEL